MGSIPTRGDLILLKFIFPFLRSGVEAHSAALSSATQHAMPPKFDRTLSGTKCLNTRLADFYFLCNIQNKYHPLAII